MCQKRGGKLRRWGNKKRWGRKLAAACHKVLGLTSRWSRPLDKFRCKRRPRQYTRVFENPDRGTSCKRWNVVTLYRQGAVRRYRHIGPFSKLNKPLCGYGDSTLCHNGFGAAGKRLRHEDMPCKQLVAPILAVEEVRLTTESGPVQCTIAEHCPFQP